MTRIFFLSTCFLMFFYSINAQKIKFTNTEWEDPAIFEIGQTLPHAFLIPFSDAESALKNDKADCNNIISLNGKWPFKLVETPDLVPEGFWNPIFDVKEWDLITVPANWQMEGYGHAKFRNVALSFESHPPFIPDYYNPVGCYKRTFSIPENWNDKEIMLRFEGVKSAFYLWVNGKEVGYNEGGFEPSEFNITPYIKIGENDLAMEVLEFCDGSYLENQDMWRLAGIFRDVNIYAQPKTYLFDDYVITDLDEKYEDALLKVEAVLANSFASKSAISFTINLFNAENKMVLEDGPLTQNVTIDVNELDTIRFETTIKNPLKWSAEYPNLYTLCYEIKNETGQTLAAYSRKIGFREIEYAKHLLTINGAPVKLNGVNSHMHHPKYGQAVPLEILRQDLILMKQFNINCVRTCHYPPTPEYLGLANELGMYIVDEVNDETHRNEWLSGDAVWTAMFRDRSRKLVYRDRNHPSIIMWSAGNESGVGFNIDEVIKTGKAIDPSRPAWMYGGNTFHIPYEDIVGPRYWIPFKLKLLAEQKMAGETDNRASFMDEYLAATGNGLGGLDEYWEQIRKYSCLTGGAIWDWVSPGIETPLNRIPDLSVNNNEGAIFGRPQFTKGMNGRGLQFTGHDEWLEFYRSKSLDIQGNKLTISLWVKPFEIPQPNSFLTKGNYEYGIRMSGPDSLEFYLTASKKISLKAKVDSNWYGNWHHIVGQYDGEKAKLYVDNQLLNEVSCSGSILNTPFPLCIGRNAEKDDVGEHSGRLSNFVVDDLLIFNKVIEPENIHSNKASAIAHLDFESDRHEGSFYSIGLGGRAYGMVWPDRRVQPELYQVKKSGQPVQFVCKDIESGIVEITNWNLFTNLNEYNLVWEISENGIVTQKGKMGFDLPAQETKEVQIPFNNKVGSESVLLLSFQTKEETTWAPKGHEIAWEQFHFPNLDQIQVKNSKTKSGQLEVVESEQTIEVSSADFSYQFDKQDACFSAIEFQNKAYPALFPQLNFWRAPSSNDIDPWGSEKYYSTLTTPGLGRSIDNQLRTLGLDSVINQVEKVEVRKSNNQSISILVKSITKSSLPNERGFNTYYLTSFQRNEEWTIGTDGTIDYTLEIIPQGMMPEMFQKVGLQFEMPKSYSNVEWLGRGPFETYPDRKTGAKFGRYQSNADEMFEPYIMPQDYGNRTDIKWLKIRDSQGEGFEIKGNEPLNFSLHKYSTDNLSRAYYTYQLSETENNFLNVDFEVSGVGATAVRQLQQYRVVPQRKTYALKITPFSEK